jgi:hypothetical protein
MKFLVHLNCSGNFTVEVDASDEAEAERIALKVSPQHFQPPFSVEHMNWSVDDTEELPGEGT